MLKPLQARSFTLHEHSPCRARSRNSQLFSRRALPRSQVTKGAVRKVIFADIIGPQKTQRLVPEIVFGIAGFYLKKRQKSRFRRTRFRTRGPYDGSCLATDTNNRGSWNSFKTSRAEGM